MWKESEVPKRILPARGPYNEDLSKQLLKNVDFEDGSESDAAVIRGFVWVDSLKPNLPMALDGSRQLADQGL